MKQNMKRLVPHLLLWLVFALAVAFIPPAQKADGHPTPTADRGAPLPMNGLDGHGLGYCVTLMEGDAQIGQVLVPFHRPDPQKRDEFTISVYNAVTLIAQNAGRPDLASKAVSLRIASPGDAVEDTTMTCVCTNTIWIGTPGKGGSVAGCGGACGSCMACKVKAIK
jgi:hypothetical protein